MNEERRIPARFDAVERESRHRRAVHGPREPDVRVLASSSAADL